MSDIESIYQTITSKKLTHEQKMMQLARDAENRMRVLSIDAQTTHYMETGAICDLFEGAAPYRPRYILPDYEKFVREGSQFLQIEPPQDLDDLLNGLMILYRHVPSITNFPVYLGNLDQLMDPFLAGLSDEEAGRKLEHFLTYLDRTITDSFCHANIGPEPTRAGRLLLMTEEKLNHTVPNFTIKYDEQITSDEFMKLALTTTMACSNPAIANHKSSDRIFGHEYGIASCYNILPIRGGAYTLSRITLTELVKEANSTEHFINELLPECLQSLCGYMSERIRFLVEKSGFFESSFLVKEGLIDRKRFVGMLGVTGLAESVNALMPEGKRYGTDPRADALGERIMQVIDSFVDSYEAEYAEFSKGRFLLHAQVGLESDLGITSGVRIPIGQEPESFAKHLSHSAEFHQYFTCGVGDIFPIASDCEKNMDALLDVVKGAMKTGVKYMSFYAADTDLVRITGFLVKRSEMDKYRKNEAVLQNTTQLGTGNYDNNHLEERKVRMI